MAVLVWDDRRRGSWSREELVLASRALCRVSRLILEEDPEDQEFLALHHDNLRLLKEAMRR